MGEKRAQIRGVFEASASTHQLPSIYHLQISEGCKCSTSDGLWQMTEDSYALADLEELYIDSLWCAMAVLETCGSRDCVGSTVCWCS